VASAKSRFLERCAHSVPGCRRVAENRSTKEHRHGEESKEGREDDEGQGCSESEEGPLAVTLTRFQIHERQRCLPTEIKGALCERLTGDAIARQEGWGGTI